MADPDATIATWSEVGNPRSRFAERPTPAIPPNDLLSAVRFGWAEGRALGSAEWTGIGLAIGAGEAAVAAGRTLRAGLPVGMARGLMVGTGDGRARRVDAWATCVLVPEDGTSAAASVRLVVGVFTGWRATVDGEGRSCVVLDRVGALVGMGAAAADAMLGGASETVRRVLIDCGVCASVGARGVCCCRGTVCCATVVGTWGVGSAAVSATLTPAVDCLVAAVLLGLAASGLVCLATAGVSATAAVDRGTSLGWARWRLRVGVAVDWATGASSV